MRALLQRGSRSRRSTTRPTSSRATSWPWTAASTCAGSAAGATARSSSLYEEDVTVWEDLQQWRIPTREIVPDRAGNTRPIPMGYLDGLGDLQTQHSCVLLVDVTETCNLECPTCFAISAPGVGRHAPKNEVLRTLDAAIAREGGRIDALMLSGGEPTVHPGIVDLIRAAVERNVTRVIINTNGIRIARDDAFLHELESLRDRVEVYLQFDGFRESTYRWHRGEDLRAVKDAAIRRLTDARIFTTLAVAVAKGVNEDEVGAILDLVFDTDYLAGVAIQPMFTAGRANATRSDGPGDHDRDDRPVRRADRRASHRGRLHRPPVLAPRLRVADLLRPPRRRLVPVGRRHDRPGPAQGPTRADRQSDRPGRCALGRPDEAHVRDRDGQPA